MVKFGCSAQHNSEWNAVERDCSFAYVFCLCFYTILRFFVELCLCVFFLFLCFFVLRLVFVFSVFVF